MTNEDAIYFNALHVSFDIGQKQQSALEKAGMSPKEAFFSSKQRLCEIGWMDSSSRGYAKREALDPQALYETMKAAGVSMVTYDHRDYPPLLKEIHSPPPLLYYRGDIRLASRTPLAVVGTRRATQYGKTMTENLIKHLPADTFVITSGLAFGIDAAAHQAALEFDKKTIAVLGSGVDSGSIYPRNNELLGEEVAKHGLLLSEHPVGTKPFPQFFPRRNRIISGLAVGTLVVEAPLKSGSMITAYEALRENRDVFAVPGDATKKTSEGPHALVTEGATLITQAQNLLSFYHLDAQKRVRRNPNSTQGLGKEPQSVLQHIAHEAMTFDQILQKTGIAQARLTQILLELELTHYIRQHMGIYSLK